MYNLKGLRKEVNKTQSEIAVLFGCGQNNISMQEKSNRDLTTEQMDILSKNFGEEVVSKYYYENTTSNDSATIHHITNNENDIRSISGKETKLLTGEGEMLLSQQTLQTDSLREKKRIPFYDDVASIGGVNSIVADNSGHITPSEWIDAGDWFPEATAAIRHYGDSMIEYPSGSILALKRVEDHRLIIWGRNYSIETTEFRITKRLQDGGDDYILAYSSNESIYSDGRLIHSPIRIPKETIRHIDLVLGCVTKEYSNGPIRIIK